MRNKAEMPWLSIPEVARARQYAMDAHAGQEYGDAPYVVHLDEVVANLYSVNASTNELIAGYLHDAVEDVEGVTKEVIIADFNAEVGDLVWSVTGIGKNRAERCASTVAKITGYLKGTRLKLCDRLANMETSEREGKRHLLGIYLLEMPKYDALFRLADPTLYARFAHFNCYNEPTLA